MSQSHSTGSPKRAGGVFWKVVVLAVVAVAAFWVFRGEGEARTPGTTFTARRGPLDIVVLEGGSVESMEKQDITSQVKGRQGAKIVSIVEEGYVVTDEDVAEGKILVELDSADLVDKLTNQEIQFQGTEAKYIEAQQGYDIQLNQNESNIKAAELTARFAHMDFEKFLGAGPVTLILETLGLDAAIETVDTVALMAEMKAAAQKRMDLANAGDAPSVEYTFEDLVIDDSLKQAIREAMMETMAQGGMTGGGPHSSPGRGGETRELTAEAVEWLKRSGVDVYAIAEDLGKLKPRGTVEAEMPGMVVVVPPARPRVRIDFTQYAEVELLEDGEAKQQFRKLEDDLLVGREEYSLATTKLEGTKRLAAREFVTQTELDVEKVKMNKAVIKVKSAQTQ